MLKYFRDILPIAVLIISIPAFSQEKCALWVTENFNRPVLTKKNISIEGRSALELLEHNASIETSYGGGFVNSVNGIKSGADKGKKCDWFYYANGVMAHIGAAGYFPKDGDIIWWDYHSWSDGVYVSSVIGSFPQPFIGGRQEAICPTVIYTIERLMQASGMLKKNLDNLGVKNVSIRPFNKDAVFDYSKNIYIVIGPWQELKSHRFIHGIYRNSKKTGFYAEFDEDSIRGLNFDGTPSAERFKEGALILAAKLGFGRDNPIWFVTGTDDGPVEKAVLLLVNDPGRIKFHAAVILSENTVIGLPYYNEKK